MSCTHPATWFDVAGAVIWSMLAIVFLLAALTPNTRTGKYGRDEGIAFLLFFLLLVPIIYCFCRLAGMD